MLNTFHKWLLFWLIVMITNYSTAQIQSHSNPIVSEAVKMGVSQPVRDLPIVTSSEKPTWKDGIIPLMTSSNHQVLDIEKDGSSKEYNGPFSPSGINKNFDGVPVDASYAVMPPDPSGDVGPNHYVQMVNLRTQIWDKNGNSLAGPFNSSQFWQTLGPPYSTSNDGDPIVLYDEIADRWLVTQFALPNYPNGPFYQLLAVSTTPDPTGTYYQYAFSFANMPDYPKFGIWPDGYYMSANQFSSGTLNYVGTYVAVFNRSVILTGGAATMIYFSLGTSTFSFLPSDCDGTAPPAGAPNNFLMTYNTTSGSGASDLDIYQFHVDWTTPANTTFTGPLLLTTPTLSEPNTVPQLGTTYKLDNLADRPMNRLQYRNLGTHEAMVVCQTVNAGAGRAGMRWWELRKTTGNWSIYQEGTYAPNDELYRWMGSIAMDQGGNIALGYSASGSTIYPDIRYTGRAASDPLGTMTVSETIIHASGGPQTTSNQRWGDYTQMTVDPSAAGTFWYTNEYIPSSGSFNWRTRIASFSFGPVISHTPLSNTENLIGPYAVNAIVSSANPLASIKLFWGRGVGVLSDSVVMTNVSGNNYTANIPGNGLSSTYNYFIRAIDNAGVAGTSPVGAPANYHSFLASVDNIPPVISHSAIGNVPQIRWPINVQANVTDNIGIQSVQCEFRVNGGSITYFPMSFVSGNLYQGTFTGSVNVGDVVEYRIKATDNSLQNNVSYSPSSGYYSFTIINVLGIVLVVDDDATLAHRTSLEKSGTGDVKTPLGASATLFANSLSAAGYAVDQVTFNALNTATLSDYDIVVLSAGVKESTIFEDQVKRTALLNYTLAGGKTITEGGEVGYIYRKSGTTIDKDAEFRRNLLLDSAWVSDRSGVNLQIATPSHSIFIIPNNIASPTTITVNNGGASGYGARDEMVLLPKTGINRIANWVTGTASNGGIFVYNTNGDTSKCRNIFYSFSISQFADQVLAGKLIVNTAEYLMRDVMPQTKTLNLTAMIEGFYNGSTMTQDTVAVELRTTSSPYNLVESRKIILNSSGTGNGTFSAVTDGTPYYLVIKHRNSIETWSKNSQQFLSGSLIYDFTTAQTQAYGDNLKQVGTKWCIYSGDVNQDGIVDLPDLTNIDNDAFNFASGYFSTDLTGDGITDLNDLLICDNNSFLFISKITP